MLGVVQPAQHSIRIAQGVVECRRQWLQLDGAFHEGNGVCMPMRLMRDQPEEVQRVGVIRVRLKQLHVPELGLGQSASLMMRKCRLKLRRRRAHLFNRVWSWT